MAVSAHRIDHDHLRLIFLFPLLQNLLEMLLMPSRDHRRAAHSVSESRQGIQIVILQFVEIVIAYLQFVAFAAVILDSMWSQLFGFLVTVEHLGLRGAFARGLRESWVSTELLLVRQFVEAGVHNPIKRRRHSRLPCHLIHRIFARLRIFERNCVGPQGPVPRRDVFGHHCVSRPQHPRLRLHQSYLLFPYDVVLLQCFPRMGIIDFRY